MYPHQIYYPIYIYHKWQARLIEQQEHLYVFCVCLLYFSFFFCNSITIIIYYYDYLLLNLKKKTMQ